MKKARIQDVADAAGVSIATVSRVVNGEPGVKPDTRTTVLNAINILQYRPGISARLMGGHRSYWVALLYQNPSYTYIHQIQEGAEEGCRKAGYMLSVHACLQTGQALEDEVRGIVDTFKPAGLILTLPMSVQPGLLKALHDLQVPFVRIAPEREADPAPRVYFDEVLSVKQITEHLIALGHREIGLVNGLPSGLQDDTTDGFRAAMTAAGLKVRQDWMGCGLYQFDIAAQAARRILSASRRPTALVAGSDDMAAGCMRAAYQLGLRVPEELSITGSGDTFASQIVSPRLTTVQQPTREMARMAVDWIVAGQAGRSDPITEVLAHRIIVGDSTAPPTRK